MSAPLLEVRDLVKTYRVRDATRVGRREFTAVRGVSFDIGAGDALAVIGESGSGKSTVARTIVGLESATSGSILLAGEELSEARRSTRAARRRRGGIVQMVFQDPYQSLDPRQRIGSCLEEALALHGGLTSAERRDRVGALLAQVRLDPELAEAFPRTLSGGQRQRVAIARALAAEPELLILDEAVAALDVAVQASVLAQIARIREETGISILFITHDLAVVQEVCERVIVMRSGEVVEAGGIEQVLKRPEHAYTRRLVDSIPRPGWKPRRGRLETERRTG